MVIKKSFLIYAQAIATLVGTIVGAGILGIPYAMSQVGFFSGIGILLFIGIILVFQNLFVGEVVLRTREAHQLPGYSQYFLGKWSKNLFGFLMVVGIFGALIAYIIGISESASNLLGGYPIWWGIGVVCFFSILIYRGIGVIKSFELFFVLIGLSVVLFISFIGLKYIDIKNIDFGIQYPHIALMYGVALFSYGGLSSIRPVREILRGREKMLKRIIIIGSVIPIFIYIIFSSVVVAITGGTTTEIATIGLGSTIGPWMFILGNVFAIFTMSTSFLMMSLALRETLCFDYKIPKIYAWFITITVPLIFYILGLRDFVFVISFIGAVGGGIQGILVVLMYWKSDKRGNRKPEYDIPQHWIIGSVLIIMFLAGIVMTFFDL